MKNLEGALLLALAFAISSAACDGRRGGDALEGAGGSAGQTGAAGDGTAGAAAGTGGAAAGTGGAAGAGVAGGGGAGAGAAGASGAAGTGLASAGSPGGGGAGAGADAGAGSTGGSGVATVDAAVDAGKPIKATAVLMPTAGNTISGTGVFTDVGGIVTLVVNVAKCPPGPHAFHLHQNPACGSDGLAAGVHWDRSEGGEIICLADGTGTAMAASPLSGFWTIGGAAASNVLLHAIIIHVNGEGGPSGARIGCGVPTAN